VEGAAAGAKDARDAKDVRDAKGAAVKAVDAAHDRADHARVDAGRALAVGAERHRHARQRPFRERDVARRQ
jgi:hypothetical protein